MQYIKPVTLQEEKKFWRKGYRLVAGIDEVGVGPLAGPVVACCLVCAPKFSIRESGLEKLHDSKLLTVGQRERYAKILKTHPQIRWAIGRAYPHVIDRINIYHATRLAMMRALEQLGFAPDFVLIDGLGRLPRCSAPQKAIVKGDRKVFSIAAASVLAKVARDRYMRLVSKKYPQYSFEIHKGYGTKLHRHAILRHGPCPLHRRSFLHLRTQ